MKNFVALIIALIHAADFVRGCSVSVKNLIPYVAGLTINETTHIRHMKTHKNNQDTKPHTIYLRTIVVVDYPMYKKDGVNVLDHVMACMDFTEKQVNKKYQYPNFKFVVTAIVIPTDSDVLAHFTPNSDTYLNTSPELFKKMQEVLSKLKIRFPSDMQHEFALFISSATSVYKENINKLQNAVSNGSYSCHLDTRKPIIPPMIVAINKINGNDYSAVYGEFVKIVAQVSKNVVCQDSIIKYNVKLPKVSPYEDCSLRSLKQEYRLTFRQCLLKVPPFLEN